ncbi:imidazoleglycerol-phosphate dehydratase [Leptospira hartskeerlii]|uniref:Imidazoleglycerol-phosphate dehydratase n=3 Tax=Leptospira TaxID=171 RepID=A0A4Z1AM13_9LEPT|nr:MULTISPECIES: imidazoleglycerol-phosphate dehydratase HisB [Leptospira]PJZ27185.1 imidazoleglycerol-phosphate dehydratase [Leptospira hartskeerlii]PJZ33844.1 imidazoleglycerol-phosphate dehydratase [Leptospira hartskeerlii]PJZ50584.1 imidazoleglycerol-phosphate dehydratase [Leptospira saintgironsiae]TGM90526.1 imidazoleglycerol-phosphate dehydratase HisB [Leptospira licerasiae]TGM97669.1 imidazoleglycerol-phosphate dehydratase HisB [Leptospira dzoumogneensis]
MKEERKTSETDIKLSLNIRGTGNYKFDTQIPFFEHMLSHVSKHGLLDIDLWLRGDIEIDCHHSVEDTAILLGATLHKQLGDKAGIRRYGHYTLPMDEVLTTVAVDLGGRYYYKYTGPELVGKFGIYDAELSLEFLQKFALNAKMNLHVHVHYGENRHHIHESIFKAFGKALRMAIEIDPAAGGAIPSTKGVLE